MYRKQLFLCILRYSLAFYFFLQPHLMCHMYRNRKVFSFFDTFQSAWRLPCQKKHRNVSRCNVIRSGAFSYYVGNIVFDISGISTKVSYDKTWRSHFCSSCILLCRMTGRPGARSRSGKVISCRHQSGRKACSLISFLLSCSTAR